ncbi:MAG: SDR family NAD(P)-dependent oxidoreductase, partial [Parvibaculum sp.]|nr:SDR family NAD(P)-dependent oxidoreductase [Parvibaculum sp.]
MKRFEGKVAVVTGGARGIGLATAERFAAEGAKVAILDLQGAEGEEAAARLNAEGSEAAFHGCDVSDRNAVEETFATVARDFGGIDILHANAGIHRGNDFLNVPVDEWDLVIDTNLKSVL